MWYTPKTQVHKIILFVYVLGGHSSFSWETQHIDLYGSSRYIYYLMRYNAQNIGYISKLIEYESSEIGYTWITLSRMKLFSASRSRYIICSIGVMQYNWGRATLLGRVFGSRSIFGSCNAIGSRSTVMRLESTEAVWQICGSRAMQSEDCIRLDECNISMSRVTWNLSRFDLNLGRVTCHG